MGESYFKLCKICNRQWPSRASFINDADVRLIGYQVNLMEIGKGLFLFNHSCDATLSIRAEEFADLYDGPIYIENKNAGNECPGYCLHEADLRPCPARCSCAYVRCILALLQPAALES